MLVYSHRSNVSSLLKKNLYAIQNAKYCRNNNKSKSPVGNLIWRGLSGSRDESNQEDEERGFKVLKKAHSLNSGVTMVRQGEGDENDEEEEHVKEVRIKHSLISGDVHGSYNTLQNVEKWRKRPLFKRAGKHVTFTSGQEAADLLVAEARRRDPYQIDFLQCVQEASSNIAVMIEHHPKLAWVFKQLMEPENLFSFRVPWTDDNGNARINRGYRIQYSSALGHYHGGLRFHPHLSHGTVRMLGWEQTFRNAIVADTQHGSSSSSSFGGAYGGSDFDPSNKSETEISRFCKNFMFQLRSQIDCEYDHIDMGVGVEEKEIKYMVAALDPDADREFIQEAFNPNKLVPGLAGNSGVAFAGFTLGALLDEDLTGKKCLISGTNSVSLMTAKQLLNVGAIPIAFSDGSGCIVNEEKGFDKADIKNLESIVHNKGHLKEFSLSSKCKFIEGGVVWESAKGDVAFPCDIQGEINADDAQALSLNGCKLVVENTDRAVTANARSVLENENMLFIPSKLATCGSHIIHDKSCPSNSTPVELDEFIKRRSQTIFNDLLDVIETYNLGSNIQAAADIYAFTKIANSEMYLSGLGENNT